MLNYMSDLHLSYKQSKNNAFYFIVNLYKAKLSLSLKLKF